MIYTKTANSFRLFKSLMSVGLFISSALIVLFFASVSSAHAEGSSNLVSDGGYRPYIERRADATASEPRLQKFSVEAEANETINLATSMTGVQLIPSINPSYDNSEIYLKSPSGVEYYVNVDSSASSTIWKVGTGNVATFAAGTGFIPNPAAEQAGPKTLSTPSGGYTPISLDVAADAGTWTIIFYSKNLNVANPRMVTVTQPWAEQGGAIAAWDITITNSVGTIKPGRVFADELFLNMGGNKAGSDVINSKIWVRTNDGFIYKVYFNGMDPFGFVFYANKRGILIEDTNGNTSSLFHSVLTNDNGMTGMDQHDMFLNVEPTVPGIDKNYHIFFSMPDATIFPADASTAFGALDANNLVFTGDGGVNKTSFHQGGDFTFTVPAGSSATSFQIKLTFEDDPDNVVILSNDLKVGQLNTIHWDGKDGNGNYLETGPHSPSAGNINQNMKASMELKGGEIHFPLLDVENNKNGVKVENITPTFESWDLYFDNLNDDPYKFSDGWSNSVKNWTSIAGGGKYLTTPISSQNGIMKFTGNNGSDWPNTGNQAALDMWTYVSAPVMINFPGIVITDDGTSINLAGTKNLQGRAIAPNDNFVYNVYDLDDHLVATGTCDTTGKISFSQIVYTDPGQYDYVVREVAGNDPHIAYDANPQKVSVLVTTDYNPTAHLVAAISYPNSGNGVTFTNVYHPNATTFTPTAWKELIKGNLQEDQFSFNLYAGNIIDDPTLSPIATRTNAIDGKISFDAIKFTTPGTYTYSMQEIVPPNQLPHITYDQSPRVFAVQVIDTNGTLSASFIGPVAGIVFNNAEQIAPNVTLVGAKNLTGRVLRGGEFSISLYYIYNDGLGNPQARQKIDQTTNDINGNYTFTLSGLYDDIYNYQIVEEPNLPNSAPVPAVTYDQTIVDVQVDASVQGNPPVVSYARNAGTSSGAFFYNQYKPQPVNAALSLKKQYANATLTAGAFSFVLSNDKGNIETVNNDADGTIAFKSLNFTKAGTYLYNAKEITGTSSDITYDSSIKQATVIVTDHPETGVLSAKVNWKNNNQTFNNIYNAKPKPSPTETATPSPEEPPEPDVPDPKTPKSHGENNLADTGVNLIWLIFISTLLIAKIVITIRPKRS